ncbi:MAG: AraC family transcriptional regulator, partial [Clostridium sp.]|nr:AraC family transcriptional regulator [Clostridium sp.]
QIAGLVGYNQVSNYIATFKRIIGCTPAQYRKQQKNESEHTQ